MRVWSEQTWWIVDAPAPPWLGVDESGRLWTQVGETIFRYALAPTVGWVDSPAGAISVTRTLSLDPTPFDAVESVVVEWGGETVVLDEPPYQWEVEPGLFSRAQEILSVTMGFADGSEITESTTLQSSLVTPTWENDIESLGTERCLRCHGGDTLTVLETQLDWVDHMDKILHKVITGEMPQGGPVLDTETIQMLQRWQDGGCP